MKYQKHEWKRGDFSAVRAAVRGDVVRVGARFVKHPYYLVISTTGGYCVLVSWYIFRRGFYNVLVLRGDWNGALVDSKRCESVSGIARVVRKFLRKYA